MESILSELELEKRIVSGTLGTPENEAILNDKLKILSTIKSAKAAMDKDAADFSWEKHHEKYAKIYEGFNLINPRIEPYVLPIAAQPAPSKENLGALEMKFKGAPFEEFSTTDLWNDRFKSWKESMRVMGF